MKKNSNEIILKDIKADAKHAHIIIEGDSDLVLNKMNARTERMLGADDRKSVKEAPNYWEDVITAIHWRDALPVGKNETYTMCNEEMLHKLLEENAPCISAFGLKKSFGQAVVRNEIDSYATKFDVSMNINAKMGLIPITFTGYAIDERLMSPKKGAPVNVKLSHFMGWKAEFNIDFFEHVYSISEIVNVINLAGFGIGIGSGRSSGYGRYHVVDVR